MLEALLCFFKFLYILELIKVCQNTHNFRESMSLQNIKELKSFLEDKNPLHKIHKSKNTETRMIVQTKRVDKFEEKKKTVTLKSSLPKKLKRIMKKITDHMPMLHRDHSSDALKK